MTYYERDMYMDCISFDDTSFLQKSSLQFFFSLSSFVFQVRNCKKIFFSEIQIVKALSQRGSLVSHGLLAFKVL